MTRKIYLLLVILLTAFPLQGKVSSSAESEVYPDAETIWQHNDATRNRAAGIVQQLLAKPLTLSSAVQIMLLNNQSLQATLEQIGIAQSDVLEAVTLPNPSVDFDVQFPATANTLNRYGWLVGEDFVRILMMPLKKRISKEALEAVELHVAAEVLDLVAEVKIAYFTLQADQQLLARLKIIQETTAASLTLAQLQCKAGNITDFALLRMQAAYDEGKLQIAEAETDFEEQQENFNQLLGLWGIQTNWKIQGELPEVPTEHFLPKHLETLAVTQRLDLQAAHREMSSLAVAYGLTKTFRWVPVLDLGFSGERDNTGSLNMGPQFRIELPIFNQGQARLARGEAELHRAAAKLEALAVTIRSDVRKYRTKLSNLADRATFYHEEALPTRIRIVNKGMLEYNAMQLSPYELLLTKADELRAERGYIDALRDFWITRTQLERTVGGTLTPRQSTNSLPAVTSKKSHPAYP
jgi:cobalt-zinc-cadmium efflux system outer membrane protein